MKYEETSEITTLLVEPGDEKAAIMRRVNAQEKPVVIVIPESAGGVFQRPGDFYELKQVMRQRETSIALVMPGNERLKYWARRQGFPVFSSIEVCAQMLAQYGPLQPGAQPMSRTTGSLVRSTTSTLKLNAALARHAVSRSTEPLVPPIQQTGGQREFAQVFEESPARGDATRDVGGGRRGFAHTAGDGLAGERKGRSSYDHARRAGGQPVMVGATLALAPDTGDSAQKDTILHVLLALLVLGVLGGIGFGYLLIAFPIALR